MLSSMKTILVPVDFSAITRRVIRTACDLARSTRARLFFLHVIEPPVMLAAVDGYDAPAYTAALTAAEKYGRRRMQRLERDLIARFPGARAAQLTGDPATVISEKAQALKPAFMVIGSHGHGAVYDLLMGSTTQGVVKRAQCPVLVVPDRPRYRTPSSKSRAR